MSQQYLSNDLIMEIMLRADPTVVCKGKTLSTYWKETLKSWPFMFRYMREHSERQRSIIFQASFPQWRGQIHSLFRVHPDYGNRMYSTLPSEVVLSDTFQLIGCENGILCFDITKSNTNPYILVWNMLTGNKRHILYPAHIPQLKKVIIFAFLYCPNSHQYCIFHGFQKNDGDKLWGYTLYSSKNGEWTKVVACRGELSRLGPEYCTNNGSIYWIKFVDERSKVAESIVVYCVASDQFSNFILPERNKKGSHHLIKYKENVCLAITAPNGIEHTITLWSFIDIRQGSFRFKSIFKLGNLGRFDNPKFFIEDDLFCISEDREVIAKGLTYIVLSRFKNMDDYAKHHMLCGSWDMEVQVKYIDEFVTSIFPV